MCGFLIFVFSHSAFVDTPNILTSSLFVVSPPSDNLCPSLVFLSLATHINLLSFLWSLVLIPYIFLHTFYRMPFFKLFCVPLPLTCHSLCMHLSLILVRIRAPGRTCGSASSVATERQSAEFLCLRRSQRTLYPLEMPTTRPPCGSMCR